MLYEGWEELGIQDPHAPTTDYGWAGVRYKEFIDPENFEETGWISGVMKHDPAQQFSLSQEELPPEPKRPDIAIDDPNWEKEWLEFEDEHLRWLMLTKSGGALKRLRDELTFRHEWVEQILDLPDKAFVDALYRMYTHQAEPEMVIPKSAVKNVRILSKKIWQKGSGPQLIEVVYVADVNLDMFYRGTDYTGYTLEDDIKKGRMKILKRHPTQP
jgi:hypothetical protein